MSKKRSKKKVQPLEADVGICFQGLMPTAVFPISPRALKLFHQWGMDEECDGIEPPNDTMDLINSFPKHWLVTTDYIPEKEEVLLQEVPLPQPRLVVH